MIESWHSNSAEKDLMLTKAEVDDMVFLKELFRDPIRRLRKVRNYLLEIEQDISKVDNAFLHSLKIVIEALGDNKYGFYSELPSDFQILISGEPNDPQIAGAVMRICKDCGVSKNGLRAWIIEDFSGVTNVEGVSNELEITEEQKRQLNLVEEIYGTDQ